MVQLTDLNFLLKFIACIVNIVILCLWTIPDKGGIPPIRFGTTVVFYLANCGYVVVLCVFVALYFLDEIPAKWSQRLFIVTGVVLFLIAGIIGLIDRLDYNSGNSLINAILCIVVGVLLLVDFIKSENFF